MRVFVVKYGDDSEYEVVTVCSTEENAQAVVDAMTTNKGDGRNFWYGEYEVDELYEFVTKGAIPWHVSMSREGVVEYTRLNYDSHHKANEAFAVYFQTWNRSEEMHAEVIAPNLDRAIERADEKRLELLASGEWDKQIDRWKVYFRSTGMIT